MCLCSRDMPKELFLPDSIKTRRNRSRRFGASALRASNVTVAACRIPMLLNMAGEYGMVEVLISDIVQGLIEIIYIHIKVND